MCLHVRAPVCVQHALRNVPAQERACLYDGAPNGMVNGRPLQPRVLQTECVSCAHPCCDNQHQHPARRAAPVPPAAPPVLLPLQGQQTCTHSRLSTMDGRAACIGAHGVRRTRVPPCAPMFTCMPEGQAVESTRVDGARRSARRPVASPSLVWLRSATWPHHTATPRAPLVAGGDDAACCWCCCCTCASCFCSFAAVKCCSWAAPSLRNAGGARQGARRGPRRTTRHECLHWCTGALVYAMPIAATPCTTCASHTCARGVRTPRNPAIQHLYCIATTAGRCCGVVVGQRQAEKLRAASPTPCPCGPDTSARDTPWCVSSRAARCVCVAGHGCCWGLEQGVELHACLLVRCAPHPPCCCMEPPVQQLAPELTDALPSLPTLAPWCTHARARHATPPKPGFPRSRMRCPLHDAGA